MRFHVILKNGEEWAGVKYTCQACGIEAVSTKLHPKGGGRKPRFCSGKCRAKASRERRKETADL
jgi:hypothetical protein